MTIFKMITRSTLHFKSKKTLLQMGSPCIYILISCEETEEDQKYCQPLFNNLKDIRKLRIIIEKYYKSKLLSLINLRTGAAKLEDSLMRLGRRSGSPHHLLPASAEQSRDRPTTSQELEATRSSVCVC